MPNKCVVQFDVPMEYYKPYLSTIPKSNPLFTDYSVNSFIDYCSRFKYDYVLIKEPKILYEHPTWERLTLWLDPSWFNLYDEILYVDTDVYALPNSKDIFQENTSKDVFKRIPLNNPKPNTSPYCDWPDTKNIYEETIFNAGVVLISRKVKELTLPVIEDYKNKKYTDDSVLLNYAVIKSGLDIVNIPGSYNIKAKAQNLSDPAEINFLHAYGLLKHKYPILMIKFLEKTYGNR